MLKYTRIIAKIYPFNYPRQNSQSPNISNSYVKEITRKIISIISFGMSSILIGEILGQCTYYGFEYCEKKTKNIIIDKKYVINKYGTAQFYITDKNNDVYNVKTSIENWHKLKTDEEVEIIYNNDIKLDDEFSKKNIISWNGIPIIAYLLSKDCPTVIDIIRK